MSQRPSRTRAGRWRTRLSARPTSSSPHGLGRAGAALAPEGVALAEEVRDALVDDDVLKVVHGFACLLEGDPRVCRLLVRYLTLTPENGPRCRPRPATARARRRCLADEEPLDVRRGVVEPIAAERVVDDGPGLRDRHEAGGPQEREVVLDRRFREVELLGDLGEVEVAARRGASGSAAASRRRAPGGGGRPTAARRAGRSARARRRRPDSRTGASRRPTSGSCTAARSRTGRGSPAGRRTRAASGCRRSSAR